MTAKTLLRTAAALAVLSAATLPIAAASANSTARPRSQRFTLKSNTEGGKESVIRVVATGPLHGVGTAQIRSSRNNRVDHMTFHLPGGTVLLIVRLKSFQFHLDPQTCKAINDGQGTFTITGGTKAFHGARGHGTYHRRTILFGARGPSGACLGTSAPPTSVTNTVTMTGTAALG